ncbi:MAG: CDP-glycerol glycerophosphotransferase family protein [Eubacterium sp.]
MNDYKVRVENLKAENSYLEMTVSVTGDKPLSFPRISACFYTDDDNRILPMDLKSCDGNTAVAIGFFDIPYLFYNKSKKSKNIGVKFLFSDGKADNIMLAPDEDVTIPSKKKNMLFHFFKSSKREKSKILFSGIMSLLFLPYRRLKVQPNKVTFLTNRSERLTGNIKAVFFEMTKIPGIEINVLCKKGGVKSNIPNLFEFFKLYATSSVVFVDDYYHFLSYLKKKDDVTLIQLWHACGAFKTFGFSRLGRDSYLRQSSPNHRQYNYVIVSSQDVIPYYAEGFGVAMEKVIALGSPRCDLLENEKYKNYFIKKFYKENPELAGKRILLFAPTFRGGGMGNCHYPIERFEVDRLLSSLDDDWVIAVKMHPYLSERPAYSEKYAGRVVDFSTQYDINDLLFVADLLVTDYSSVIFEASIVNVPMVFFAFDLNEYSRDRDFYCNFSSFVPGKIVLSTDEMINAINNKDFKQELIEPFRERFFGSNTGHATENVVNFTKELLNS